MPVTYNDHTSDASPNDTDKFPFWDAVAGATRNITWALIKSLVKSYSDANALFKDGTMWNGKIQVSVASNNITVALKTKAGTDPSSTNPVYVMINGTLRTITSALSVTKNAGTNWFASGSSENAGNEIDYFVYLIWNTTPATDVIDIGFARIPFGRVYGDFSSTSTNEKYLAHANASDPLTADDLVVIGRFAASLSASASFNWSVPTFTNVNLIQHPIYETRWMTWTPTFSASGSMTYTSVTPSINKYKIVYDRCHLFLKASGTTGGTASTQLLATVPFESLDSANDGILGAMLWNDGTAGFGGSWIGTGTPDLIKSIKYDFSNWGLGAGRQFNVQGIYRI